MCQCLFFNKVKKKNKKEALGQVLSCEFCEIYKTTFFIKHLRWLLLSVAGLALLNKCSRPEVLYNKAVLKNRK